jgi:NRAMP (natural resistance-associated macrophage protein)-like metal ion transporter
MKEVWGNMMAQAPKSPRDKEQDKPVIPDAAVSEGAGALESGRTANPIVRFLKLLGPGFITGASDDDPSGIGTYAVAGASLGFATLWTALLSFPLMFSVQYICAKIGLVSGRGLAGALREVFPRWLLYIALGILIIANTINAGTDIGAIAAAINLLIPIPILWLIVPIALVILAMQIWGSYRLISRIFKWLALALVAYIGSALFAHPHFGEVLRNTFIPTFRLTSAFIATFVAILGTTISPYLFFWQADEEVEEQISRGRKRLWQRRGASDSELRYAGWDVGIGMFFSQLVMYFIILSTAATLFTSGHTNIQSATDAAQALRPLAGNAASVLLAVGLIGSGFLAVPILTGSGAYAVAETFGWRHGLDERLGRAKEFYLIIIASTLVGMLINFVGINPIQALFWTAVLNGVLAPPLLVLIMILVNKRKVLLNHTNGTLLNILGWLTAALMGAAAIGLFVTLGK